MADENPLLVIGPKEWEEPLSARIKTDAGNQFWPFDRLADPALISGEDYYRAILLGWPITTVSTSYDTFLHWLEARWHQSTNRSLVPLIPPQDEHFKPPDFAQKWDIDAPPPPSKLGKWLDRLASYSVGIQVTKEQLDKYAAGVEAFDDSKSRREELIKHAARTIDSWKDREDETQLSSIANRQYQYVKWRVESAIFQREREEAEVKASFDTAFAALCVRQYQLNQETKWLKEIGRKNLEFEAGTSPTTKVEMKVGIFVGILLLLFERYFAKLESQFDPSWCRLSRAQDGRLLLTFEHLSVKDALPDNPPEGGFSLRTFLTKEKIFNLQNNPASKLQLFFSEKNSYVRQ